MCKEVKPRRAFDEDPSQGTRPVRRKCRRCRSDAYYSKRYTDRCVNCHEPRRLNNNMVCPKCNEEAGLRECTRCKDVLPTMWFYGEKKRCVDCYRATRASGRVLVSTAANEQ